ncbi:zinc finger protein [Sesbania bispinosa]|nr:zinc finger protein [Sesbania bispinosa]
MESDSVPLIVPLNEFRCLDCSAMYSTLKSLGEHICEGKVQRMTRDLIDAFNTNPQPEVAQPTPKPNAAQNVGGVDANAPPTPFYVDDDSSGRTLDLLWMMERTSGSVPNLKSTKPSGNAADGVDLDLKL